MWSTRRRDPRIRDEIAFHRDRLIDDYVAGGMDRKEAEHRAFLQFGNPAQIEESVRDVRGRWLEDLGRDLRYAARTLSRGRGFTAAALLSLGLASQPPGGCHPQSPSDRPTCGGRPHASPRRLSLARTLRRAVPSTLRVRT